MLFCTYSVYIYKISRHKLTSTRRDGGLFELLECVQPIRSRVWTIERFKTKTNDRNESWMKVGLYYRHSKCRNSSRCGDLFFDVVLRKLGKIQVQKLLDPLSRSNICSTHFYMLFLCEPYERQSDESLVLRRTT